MPIPGSELRITGPARDRIFAQQHPNVRPLSRTTVSYAKWIHSGQDEPDHRGQTLATRSPHVIRTWVEARNGVPVKAETGSRSLLLLDFPHDGSGDDERLTPIAWKEWLAIFEARDLVFLYQETLANGRQSNFFRLDSPEREDD
jgi:hypothetical protein